MSNFIIPKTPTIVNPALFSDHLDKMAVENDMSLKHLFVIFNHKYFHVVHDPMTRKPVNNRNRHLLEAIVKEIGHEDGKLEIMTAHDAFVKIIGRKPNQ